jgi:hypothetical protein
VETLIIFFNKKCHYFDTTTEDSKAIPILFGTGKPKGTTSFDGYWKQQATEKPELDCLLCQGLHLLRHRRQFRALSHQERNNVVMKKELCIIALERVIRKRNPSPKQHVCCAKAATTRCCTTITKKERLC